MEKNNIAGWMSEAELKVLWEIGKYVKPYSAILEIGSFMGRSTFTWSDACDTFNLSGVVCVDPWEGTLQGYPAEVLAQMNGDTDYLDYNLSLYSHFLINVRDCDNIFPVRMASRDFHWIMVPHANPPGLIFIDGDHSSEALAFDLAASLPGAQYGADAFTLICGHDYGHPDMPHIKPMVDAFAADNGMKVTHYPDTMIFALRR